MSLLTRNIPTARDLRLFGGLWLPLALLALAAIAFLKGRLGLGAVFAPLSLASAAIGWARPEAFRVIFHLWMGLVFPIGWLISHLLLGAIYFVVFTLTGLLLRCWRDPMERRFDRAAKTYWKPCPPGPERERDYFNQF